MGQIEDGCIHALRQAEVVGMEQRWLAVLVLTGLGTEAGCSAPDQGIQQRGCEHQHQRWRLEQRQQGADTEVDHVLQQQPAPRELASAGLFTEGEQGMAEIARHRGGQEGDGVGQAQAHPRAQQQQNADVNGCGGASHHAIPQQAVQQRNHSHCWGVLLQRCRRASISRQACCS